MPLPISIEMFMGNKEKGSRELWVICKRGIVRGSEYYVGSMGLYSLYAEYRRYVCYKCVKCRVCLLYRYN